MAGMAETPGCAVFLRRLFYHGATLPASLSGTFLQTAVTGYATGGALAIFSHLFPKIAPVSSTLSPPSVTFTKGLCTETVETE